MSSIKSKLDLCKGAAFDAITDSVAEGMTVAQAIKRHAGLVFHAYHPTKQRTPACEDSSEKEYLLISGGGEVTCDSCLATILDN